MTFLPILEREVRVQARGSALYWSRCAAAMVGLLASVPQLLMSGQTSAASIGKNVFNGLVGAAFMLSCGACLVTADAISSERREGTLGLLFLTRVRPADVLVGKFGSIGIAGLGATMAFLPLLMLPLLAGGVTAGEAARKGLVLLITLAFALVAGLYASVFTTERFKAARIALAIVIMFGFVPVTALTQAGDMHYRATPGSYWTFSLGLLAFAGAILVLTGLELRRSLREHGSAPSALPLIAPELPFKAISRRQWPRLAGSPVEWLVRNQRGIKPAIWAAGIIAMFSSTGIMFLPQFFLWRVRFTSPWAYILQLPSLGSAIICGALLAWAASRFFAEGRRTGELELLQTTPLGAKTLVFDQWHALKSLLGGPVVLMVIPFFLPLLSIVTGMRRPPFVWYFISWVLGLANVFLGIGALCWVAMWLGWQARTHARAVVWTVAIAKGLPFLVATLAPGLLYVLLNILTPLGTGGPGMPIAYTVSSWIPQLFITLFYGWLIREAKHALLLAVASNPPGTFSWLQYLLQMRRETALSLRKARHWTPSS